MTGHPHVQGNQKRSLFTFSVSPQIYCTVAWQRKDSYQHRYRGCVDTEGSKEENTGRPDFYVTGGKKNYNKQYILDTFVAWKRITFSPNVSRRKCFLFIVNSSVPIYLYMCECTWGRLIFLSLDAQIGLSEFPDTAVCRVIIIHLTLFTAEQNSSYLWCIWNSDERWYPLSNILKAGSWSKGEITLCTNVTSESP